MKCWVEGSECKIHSENCESGVLNVTDGFCQGCFVVREYRERISETIKMIGLIDEYDLGDLSDELYDKSGIVLDALKLLEKKQKKKIAKAIKVGKEERMEILRAEFNDIRKAKKIFNKFVQE